MKRMDAEFDACLTPIRTGAEGRLVGWRWTRFHYGYINKQGRPHRYRWVAEIGLRRERRRIGEWEVVEPVEGSST